MQRSFILKKKEENVSVQKKSPGFEDMQKFESELNDDIEKIRVKIDDISKDFLELQKRFEKAEKEYLDAKEEIFAKGEEKDKLIQTLRGFIEKSESEKAKKFSQFLCKYEIKSKIFVETDSENK